ncbi:VapC toxin family PIN domain ribonuclease [Cellulosimicrobium cellulans]|uniref:Ribonuclease VapC n=1 Tax=Cellulosimicrobium cellulans TaxID=1710 RepID=A0A1Y0HZB8_CELCE|nr:type II toxin-antitoxin system VapC family toxin [Cellulosimicrobium cellulans]ARU53349.1 VapC toxin family PIN domain ribonuclease [Cellulosimicrobium cellulans]
MRYLLDTNVVSELVRTRADQQVVAWLRGLRTHQIYVSVLTIGEIRTGVQRLVPRDAARAAALETWVHGLEETYGDRILPVTLEIAQRWPAVHAARPLPVVDSLLAATALAHGLTVATRNTKDFADRGAPVVNPFSSP